VITKIKLTNFQSHKDTELELHPGLNVIYGESDQGKTAILRALTWVMTNRPLSNRFLMRGAKECRVEITTDKGTVVRERRRGFNGYIVNGETFKEIGSSVPPQVAEVLNLGEINLQPQLSPFFLITQSPGQIARYISELLGYDVIDLAQSECKSRLTAATSLVNETSASMQQVNEQLDKLSVVDELQELLAQADEADERRAGLVEQKARLEFNLNEAAEQSVAIESYRRTLDGVEQVNDQLSGLVEVELQPGLLLDQPGSALVGFIGLGQQLLQLVNYRQLVQLLVDLLHGSAGLVDQRRCSGEPALALGLRQVDHVVAEQLRDVARDLTWALRDQEERGQLRLQVDLAEIEHLGHLRRHGRADLLEGFPIDDVAVEATSPLTNDSALVGGDLDAALLGTAHEEPVRQGPVGHHPRERTQDGRLTLVRLAVDDVQTRVKFQLSVLVRLEVRELDLGDHSTTPMMWFSRKTMYGTPSMMMSCPV
jgi:energy-coupling factor transporter ATP-binding protein EcfA2